MIVSRGLFTLQLGRNICKNLCKRNVQRNLDQIRWSSHGNRYTYRSYDEPSKVDQDFVKYSSAFVWWWVLWHFFTDYEEFFGPFMPNPAKWTDKELGVPPL